MKFEEAKKKTCAFLGKKCILEECMFWNTIVNGEKEIERYQIPYDTYPSAAGSIHRQLIKDGYVELPRSEGREMYAKYEHAQEGYCEMINKVKKKESNV